MEIKKHAHELINKFYQPLGKLHCHASSNDMWEYAKRCALILVDEIIDSNSLEPQLKRHVINNVPPVKCLLEYWFNMKTEINNL